MELPPLPPLNDKLHLLMRGPTLASNWVIPGMIMAGAYPGAQDDRENELQLKSILNKGVDEFVCLQAEVDEDIPEEEWRAGYALRPYFVDARKFSKKPLIWRHLPIVDGCAAQDDEVMEALLCDLLDDVKAGKVLYIHCLGGHGRTGIVVSLMLAVLYGLPVTEAFKRVQGYHDCRIEPQGVKSPQTVVQRSQVKRLLDKWKNNSKQQESEISAEVADDSAKEPQQPQVIIGKNGARGFAVPMMDRAASLPKIMKDESMDRAASLPKMMKDESTEQAIARMKAPVCKPVPSPPGSIVRSSSVPSLRNGPVLQRSISLHAHQPSPPFAARLCKGKAAGNGVAAIQMIRKSSAKPWT